MTLQPFKVPDIGEGLAEVELVEWKVSIGDAVTEHQVLATVETDKAVVELPSPYDGTIRELCASPGQRLPVGFVAVVIDTDSDVAAESSSPPAHATTPTPTPATPAAVERATSKARAAPAVRRLARELGVDLESVTPSGRGGIVTADDVRAAMQTVDQPPPATTSSALSPPAGAHASGGAGRAPEIVVLRGLRRTIAANMTVVAQVPHITSHREVDASGLIEWRRRANARRAEPLTFTPFFALCVIGALRAVPALNATYDPDRGELGVHRAIHLGIATATDDGLIVPVVHDADLLGLDGIAAEIERLSTAARQRSLATEAMRGGTFTITNYGSQGGWFGTPLLHLPEIGIAGFGRITERPWARHGELVVAPVLPLSVSVDHRIIDGDVAGRFSDALASNLQDPTRLLERVSSWS